MRSLAAAVVLEVQTSGLAPVKCILLRFPKDPPAL